jgi:hypothetical protein
MEKSLQTNDDDDVSNIDFALSSHSTSNTVTITISVEKLTTITLIDNYISSN